MAAARADRICRVAGLIWIAFGLSYFGMGRPRTATLDVVVGLATLALALPAVRARLLPDLRVHVFVALSTFAVAYAALTSGGADSLAIWWMPAIPVFAAYQLGIGPGLGWSAGVIAAMFAVVVLHPLGWVETEFVPDGLEMDAGRAALILFMGLLAAQARRYDEDRVSDLAAARAAARRHNERLHAVLDRLDAGLLFADGDGVIDFASRPVAGLLGPGVETSDVVGLRVAELLAKFEGSFDDPDDLLARAADLLADPRHTRGREIHFRDGRVVEAEHIPVPDPDGGEPGHVWVLEDVTEAREELRNALLTARRDKLTGLPGREEYERLLARKLDGDGAGARFGLLFVDLDDLKPVNDLHGHAAGDEVIVEAARRIRSCLRATDLVARIGGDEFVVVVGGTGAEAGIERLAGTIQAVLGQPFRTSGGHVVSCAASIGTALQGRDGDTAAALHAAADAAMYADKAIRKGTPPRSPVAVAR